MSQFPPDDYTVQTVEKLREWYATPPPDGLGEVADDRAIGVWISGSNGWVAIWQSPMFAGDVPETRKQNIWQVLRQRILDTKFPPPAPPVPPVTPGLQGILRLTPQGYADDRGPVLLVGCHGGSLFSQYAHGDMVYVADALDAVAAAGFHAVRSWTVLGFQVWHEKGLAINESRPGYWGHVRGFCAALKARGLAWIVSQGDVRGIQDRRTFMWSLGLVGTEYPGTLAFVDAGNESFQTGEDDPAKLAQMLRWYRETCSTGILSLSSPPGEETAELDAFSIDPAHIFDKHGYRDGTVTDKTRHAFSVQYEGQPMRRFGIESEPPARGASVTANEHELDDEAMGLLAAQHLMCRMAFVLMSGPGVWGDAPFSSIAGLQAVPRMARALPADVMSYGTLIHGGTSQARRVLTANQGELRCDHALGPDGRFCVSIYGPHPPYTIPVSRGFVGDLIHPATGERTPLSAATGSLLNLNFTRGRVLVGRVA